MIRLLLAALSVSIAVEAAADDLPCAITGTPCEYACGNYVSLHYVCRSTSHHVEHVSEEGRTSRDVWWTEIDARLAGGPVAYSATINTLGSPDPGLLEEEFGKARDGLLAAAEAAGRLPTISPPRFLGRWTTPVTGLHLSNVLGARSVIVSTESATATWSCGSFTCPVPVFTVRAACVGDLGDDDFPSGVLPEPPCPPGSFEIVLEGHGRFDYALPCYPCVDDAVSTRTHTATTVYDSLVLTGNLVSNRYELVGDEVRHSPVQTLPQPARPRPRTIFP